MAEVEIGRLLRKAKGWQPDYTATAAAEPRPEQLLERKVCEGLCGGYFWRPVPMSAREGEKICAECKVALETNPVTADVRKRPVRPGGRGNSTYPN